MTLRVPGIVLAALLSLMPRLSVAGEARSIGQSGEPFVGCRSEGQAGRIASPATAPPRPTDTKPVPQGLVLYASETQSVAGPVGWWCYGISNSDESTLFVTPDRDEIRKLEELGFWRALETNSGPVIPGPVIQASFYSGAGVGLNLARVVERGFPVAEPRARQMMERHGITDYYRGPEADPQDGLVRRNDTWVEYTTGMAGLAGLSYILPNGPISGAAILDPRGEMTVYKVDLRLPTEIAELTPLIITDFETSVMNELNHDANSRSRRLIQNLCPVDISTEESLPKPLEGWRPTLAMVENRLNDVDVNLGPPAFVSGAGRESTSWGFLEAEKLLTREDAWHLTPGTTYWLRCGYSRSRITLSKPVPLGVTECHAYYPINDVPLAVCR